MRYEPLFMNKHTGRLDTLDTWKNEIKEEFWCHDLPDDQFQVFEADRMGAIVGMVCDENGNWVELK